MKAEKEQLLKRLPRRYAEEIHQTSWTRDLLLAEIAEKRQLMKNDLWFGIPWAIIFLGSLWYFGYTTGTIAILLVGIVYFSLALWKFGSYGVNRKRVRIYELLLEEMR